MVNSGPRVSGCAGMMTVSELSMSVLIVIIITSPIFILNQEIPYNIIGYS